MTPIKLTESDLNEFKDKLCGQLDDIWFGVYEGGCPCSDSKYGELEWSIDYSVSSSKLKGMDETDSIDGTITFINGFDFLYLDENAKCASLCNDNENKYTTPICISCDNTDTVNELVTELNKDGMIIIINK